MLRFLAYTTSLLLFLTIVGAGAGLYAVWHFGQELPEYRQLVDYEPPVTTRVHAADGSLMVEYAQERRVFVPIAAIPVHVKEAFLSAEDKSFYSHPGIDVFGIGRAVLTNLQNLGRERRPVGASTITQQVAKNFLLTNEVSIARKAKEAILAFRIEQALSKDRILELYLNEIYLGQGSYGVAAAALSYFGKSLDELDLGEAAQLASLPKAPNNYHPVRRNAAATERRNWVLGRMVEDGFITDEDRDAARAEPVRFSPPPPTRLVEAGYFAEEVRRLIAQRYGDARLYQGGLSVRTTLEPGLQTTAHAALRDGLEAYDRRNGWRGAGQRLEVAGDWKAALAALPVSASLGAWRQALVLRLSGEGAEIGFADGSTGLLAMAEMTWARRQLADGGVGPRPAKPADVVAPGDVVVVDWKQPDKNGKGAGWSLRQLPEVNGALVAMDPHTGRVLAMVGGWSQADSEFNRATQALRQPGSAFKPFVYAAALDSGFTPSSLVLDAPFVLDQGPLGKWKPENYSQEFYGPSTLRLGIEKSRNLMTVRLAQNVGMEKVVDYARRFGIADSMQPYLPMSLGAGETTVLKLTTAYAMLVNGGRRIEPTLVDRVQDRTGRTIYRHDERPCPDCREVAWAGQTMPVVPDAREQVIDPVTAYQVVSMLQGVVQRGTGARIAALGRPLAGKTGTTNESRDAWFVGFSPDLAVGVWVGFDEPRSLGKRETGSSVAVPIWKDFMEAALKGEPQTPFRIPPGVRLVRVDAKTGEPVLQAGAGTILEAFREGQVPGMGLAVLDGSPQGGGEAAVVPAGGLAGGAAQGVGDTPRTGTGGLY